MGIKEAWNRQMERSKAAAMESREGIAPRYGLNYVNHGDYFGVGVKKPVAGAVAEFESGAAVGGRTTLTRVAAGAIVAGPVGAIVGGMFKKDRSKVYVTVTFPDGQVVVVDGPSKDESKLRQFAAEVSAAGRHYAVE